MLIWIDCETTGLEDTSELLELACVVTQNDGEVVDKVSWVVRPHALDLKKMSPEVVAMHTQNGLFADCVKPSAVTAGMVDGYLEQFLSKYIPANSYERPYLCGSSVHFDRNFLSDFTSMKKFHYRNFDVTTLRKFMEIVDPEAYSKLKTADGNHRALPDILSSINIYQQIHTWAKVNSVLQS